MDNQNDSPNSHCSDHCEFLKLITCTKDGQDKEKEERVNSELAKYKAANWIYQLLRWRLAGQSEKLCQREG